MNIFGLSLSLSTILVYLIHALIAWIALIVADSIIAHNIETKKTLVLSLLSFLVVPLALPVIGLIDISDPIDNQRLQFFCIFLVFLQFSLDIDFNIKLSLPIRNQFSQLFFKLFKEK